MKTTVNEDKNATPNYPYIGKAKDSGLVVLFYEKQTGVVLKESNLHPIGHHKGCWVEDNFTPLKGTITLSNN